MEFKEPKEMKIEFLKNELIRAKTIKIIECVILGISLLIPRIIKWIDFEIMAGKCVMILLFLISFYDIVYLIVLKESKD